MADQVRDIAAFTAFAEKNPQDAFRFFKSDEFLNIIPAEDHRSRALWWGLMHAPLTRASMEEFLAGTGRKDPVTVTADVTEASFYQVKDSIQEMIRLRRSGWGSFVMNVCTDADFIELPRVRITEEAFVGSSFDLPYRILIGKLGAGVRTGTIWIEGPCCRIAFTVTASAEAEDYTGQRAEIDRNTLRLLKLRLDYMLDRVSRSTYVTESLEMIETHYCISTEKLTLMRLYQAYLEKLRGNTDEAAAILREFRDMRFPEEEQEEELSCLYMRSLISGDPAEAEDTAVRIRSRFDGRRGSYLLLKLLLLSNPDIGHYPRRRRKAAEQMYEAGVRSPLLYAEILRDLRQDDSLVTQLSDCTVQTLLFAVRQDLLTEALALRAAYLSANEKYFSPPLLRILTEAYEKWPLDGILEAIVRMLMKGQPRDGRCFPWYEKAVEKNLRIIRLYEYYIETMPETRRQILPLQIRKYFELSPESISEESRAAVYANVVRNRDVDPDTYEAYRAGAEAFAMEALRNGKTGGNYAVLYQEFVRRITDRQSAEALTRVMFTESLYLEDDSVRAVVVIHDGLKEEQVVPVAGGRAFITRYTDDARILFENAASQRFIAKADYHLAPLMDSGKLLPLLEDRKIFLEPLLLYETRKMEKRECRDAGDFELWKSVARSDKMTDSIRAEARRQILHYLSCHPETPFFHRGTSESVFGLYAEADLVTLADVLLGAGLFRECYRILLAYGSEGISPEIRVRLASRMIAETEEKDEELIRFSMDVFRTGKYDETMLEYLSEHFSGSTEDMMELRACADSFFIDTFSLDDRLLVQFLREKKRPENADGIFTSYVEHGGRRAVIREYLEQVSDEILGTDRTLCEAAAVCIAEYFDRKEPVDFAMKLALLQYYSSRESLTAHDEMLTDVLLAECSKRNVWLGFMKKLPSDLIHPYHLKDRTFVEQKADPAAEVLITYTMRTGLSGEDCKERTEQMVRRFRGIFSREFLLFYGESLTYRITVRDGTSKWQSGEVTLCAEELPMSGTESFPRINRMLRAAREGSEDTLKEELRSYMKARDAAQSLFALEETL